MRDQLPVIVNFEETDDAETTRLMDFISGSTYALDGHVKPVSKKVYIFAPNNISFETNEGQKNW